MKSSIKIQNKKTAVLKLYNLKQLVNVQTHNKGGTLDLIISSKPSMISDIDVVPNLLPSDHFPLCFSVQAKPETYSDKETYSFRNWKTLNVNHFKEDDICESPIILPC